MRIIAGTLGGHRFNSPKSDKTHPMSEKIRGAIFNMLGDITGLSILDAYAGSGAISFEAISRGAVSAVAIEKEAHAARVISQNITSLALQDTVTVSQTTVSNWIAQHPERAFDLVIADPPYDAVQIMGIQALAQAVAADGLLIVSSPAATGLIPVAGLQVIKQKQYGDATITVYAH